MLVKKMADKHLAAQRGDIEAHIYWGLSYEYEYGESGINGGKSDSAKALEFLYL